jgi:hypothetical protein
MGILHIGVKDVGEEMLDRLQALPQVRAVNHRDGTLAFEIADAQRALLEIIGLVGETDTPIYIALNELLLLLKDRMAVVWMVILALAMTAIMGLVFGGLGGGARRW